MFTIFYCYLTWTARAAISARTVASNLWLRLASMAAKPSGGKAQAARCKFGLSGLQRVHLRARATASKRVAAKRFDEGHPAPATPMGDAPLDPVLDENGFRVLQPNETVPKDSFLCMDCDYIESDTLRCASHKKKKPLGGISCHVCMSVYKATARKWIKDRKLQTWFNSLAGEKRTKHFQKHRLINKTKSKGMRGKKILVLSTAFSKQSRRIAKRIHWRDWNVYKAEMSDKGLTVADARKQWNLDLMTQGVPNKKENGVRKSGSTWATSKMRCRRTGTSKKSSKRRK